MIKKNTTIYRCEYCKPGKRKTYLVESAAKRHEESCLYNPHRLCRECNGRQDVKELTRWLESFIRFHEKKEINIDYCNPYDIEFALHEFHIDESFSFDKLIQKEDCLFCQMAAILQSKFDIEYKMGFSFEKAKKLYFEQLEECRAIDLDCAMSCEPGTYYDSALDVWRS